MTKRIIGAAERAAAKEAGLKRIPPVLLCPFCGRRPYVTVAITYDGPPLRRVAAAEIWCERLGCPVQARAFFAHRFTLRQDVPASENIKKLSWGRLKAYIIAATRWNSTKRRGKGRVP